MFILLLNLKGFNHNVAHPYDGTVKMSCDQNLSFVHDLQLTMVCPIFTTAYMCEDNRLEMALLQ